MHSAYRRHHSSESALERVHNDIIRAIDNHPDAVLVLLDLSAAFDTVDRTTLLYRQKKNRLGLSDIALEWFCSYLSGRRQRVCIGTDKRTRMIVMSNGGVPRGSVFGPLTFIVYSTPISDICRKHGLAYHLYTDGTQLELTFKHGSAGSDTVTIRTMKARIADIRRWMAINLQT